MPDYNIGYGKPPKASQFKPGVSGNPKGRPKRRAPDLNAMISDVLNTPVRHREGGQLKTTPAWELSITMQVRRALNGDVPAAAAVLEFWIRAGRRKSGAQCVVIEDWMPDYEGQTAEEKTRDFARKRNATATEWWSPPPAQNKKP